MPVKPRAVKVPHYRIGDLVYACEQGLRAYAPERRCRAPRWLVGSKLLQQAYRIGWDNARRMEGATDGTAR